MSQFPGQNIDPWSMGMWAQAGMMQPQGLTFGAIADMYQPGRHPVFSNQPATLGAQVGQFLAQSPLGPVAAPLMMGVGALFGPEAKVLGMLPPMGQYSPYQYLQTLNTAGLSPSLHNIRWGGNWQLGHFDTTAGQDRYFSQVRQLLTSGQEILSGGSLDEQTQLDVSRTAASIANFSRSNMPLAGELRKMMKWMGIEDQSFMISGLNQMFGMMGDEVFDKQARQQIYKSLTTAVSKGGQLDYLGFEEAGTLLSDLSAAGLIDIRGMTKGEQQRVRMRREAVQMGDASASDLLDIGRITLSDGLDAAELERVDEILKSNLEAFKKIAQMGERYGVDIDDITGTVMTMTGGRAGRLIDRIGVDTFKDKMSELFEVGRLAGFSGPETAMQTAGIAAMLQQRGLEPGAAIDIARRAYTSTAEAMWAGGGRGASPQAHIDAVVRKEMDFMQSETGMQIALMKELETQGVLAEGATEKMYAGGARPTNTEVMSMLMQETGMSEGEARQFFSRNYMRVIAGRYTDDINNIMMGADSPQGARALLMKKGRRFGVSETKLEEFYELLRGGAGWEEALERTQIGMDEREAATYRMQMGRTAVDLELAPHIATREQFAVTVQAADGTPEAKRLSRQRARMREALQAAFEENPDINIGRGFLGMMESLSKYVKDKGQLDLMGIAYGFAGADPEKIRTSIDEIRKQFGSDEYLAKLTKTIQKRERVEPGEAREMAIQERDEMLKQLENLDEIFREKAEEIKEIFQEIERRREETAASTKDIETVGEKIDNLLEGIKEAVFKITGTLGLTEESGEVIAKISGEAQAAAESQRPGGITS